MLNISMSAKACVLLLAPALTMAITVSAHAQDLETLQKCTAIKSDTKRLACFDTAMRKGKEQAARITTPTKTTPSSPQITQAEEARIEKEVKRRVEQRLVIKEKEAAEKRKVSEFGKNRAPETVDRLEEKIKQVKRIRNRGTLILLENGSLWEQTEGREIRALKKGVTVIIKKGLLGAYRLNIKGRGAVIKVRRKK